MTVTIFRNLADIAAPHQITLSEALDRIKNGRSKEKVEAIRKKLFLGEDYSQDKKDLPFVVFSAAKTQAVTKINQKTEKEYQTHRLDESVVEHSGVFVLDFDNCDVGLKKEQLKRDSFIYAVWTGPSGTGVKALVKCPPNIQNHDLYYTAFLARHEGLDKTSRNISRGTYESYDPDLWVNENSLIWDKKMTEEERKKVQDKEVNKRGNQIKATAVSMVRAAGDGEKHDTLRNAAVLLGGAVAIGKIKEEEAIHLLETEIRHKDIKDFDGAQKTIRAGLEYGKKRPLSEIKKLEKAQQYVRRENGDYDFLADTQAMDEYLIALVNGTLEFGKPTGMNKLNAHWLFKKHTLVFMVGAAGVGKSYLAWYLSLLYAALHGIKVIMHSAENHDGELRKKLIEFYMGKPARMMDDEELTIARDFVQEHYRIVSSTQMHTLDDFLMKCEILIDEGFDAGLVIAEPYNSFEIPSTIDSYRNNIHCLNLLRVFKESYCSVWICDHITTIAARQKDRDGYALAPSGSDVEMGTMKKNKTCDLLVFHRQGNHPLKKYDTEIHVEKIKSEDSGGSRTEKDNPVIVTMTPDRCGYTCDGQNPIIDYWKNKNEKI